MTIRRTAAAVVALAFVIVAAGVPTPAAGHEVFLLFGRTAAGQLRIDAQGVHVARGVNAQVWGDVPVPIAYL